MLQLIYSKQGKKSLKKLRRSGRFYEIETALVLNKLIAGRTLEARYRNHLLQGKYAGCFECHIKSDLLLIYEIDESEKTLTLVDIGSHSDLFR